MHHIVTIYFLYFATYSLSSSILPTSQSGSHIGPLRGSARGIIGGAAGQEVVRRLPPLQDALPVAAVGRALRAPPRLILPRRSCPLQVSVISTYLG